MNFEVHPSLHSDLQRSFFFKRFDGLRCSQWSLRCKMYPAFVKDQKADFKLGGGGITVSQGIQSHLRNGSRCSAPFQEVGLHGNENLFQRGSVRQSNRARSVYLNHAANGKLSVRDFAVNQQSGFICGTLLSTTKANDTLRASAATKVGITVNTGTAADFGQLNQMNDSAGDHHTIPQKPSAPLGWLSLGLCGNALIMKVGADARCFHHQSLPCGLVELGEHSSCGDVLYAPADVGWSCSGIRGRISKVEGQEGVSLIQSKPITTKSQVESFRDRRNKQKRTGKTAILTRDIFERSSFHLFEHLFCYPFLSPNAISLNVQIPSRKSLKELVSILNRTAVGLAGVSVTWLLFVASRILWLDVSLNKHDITSLAMGFGFLSLSWVMKRVSDAFMCLADVYNRSKMSKQEYIIGLQRELQCIALSAILLVVILFMGGG